MSNHLEEVVHQPMLLITPEPYADESFDGYCCRAAQENGYENWRDFIRYLNIDFNKPKALTKSLLSLLTGHSMDGLVSPRDAEFSKLNGHLLPKRLLGGKSICPQCIQDNGYHRGLFDLKGITACTKHKRILINQCSSCNAVINEHRASLLVCTCKHNHRKSKPVAVSEEVLDLEYLLQAIESRHSITDQDSKTGMPFNQLSKLTLASCLSIFETIGMAKCMINTISVLQQGMYIQINEACAQVFKDWPNNFVNFLGDFIDVTMSMRIATSVEWQRFDRWDASPELELIEQNFMLDQYFEYLLYKWPVQNKIYQNKCLPEAPTTPKRIFAIVMGTNPKWVDREIQESRLFEVRLLNNSSNLKMIRVISNSEIKQHAGYTFNKEKAGQYLGVSDTLLTNLKNSGFLLQLHHKQNPSEIPQFDLDAFLDQLRLNTVDYNVASDELITFSTACRSEKRKSNFHLFLLISWLKGEIKAQKGFEGINDAIFRKCDLVEINNGFKEESISNSYLFSKDRRCVNSTMLQRLREQNILIDPPFNYPDLLRI